MTNRQSDETVELLPNSYCLVCGQETPDEFCGPDCRRRAVEALSRTTTPVDAGLRDALDALAMAAGELTVATDGMEQLRPQRLEVLAKMQNAAAALEAIVSSPVDRGGQ